MSKKIKFSYILSLIVFGVCIAWNTFSGFFNGVGINYVAILGTLAVLTFWFIEDKEVRHRVLEIFIAVCVVVWLETICYFFFEIVTPSSYNAYLGFLTFQKVISVLSIFLFVYTMVRFMLDVKKVKVHFFEVMLGNEKRAKKQKVEKQISNGSLGKKPNTSKAVEGNGLTEKPAKTTKPNAKEEETIEEDEEEVEPEVISAEQVIVEEPEDEE